MRLTLALPSLLWSAALGQDTVLPNTPVLAQLLAGRRVGGALALGPEEWLAERCGLPTRPDPALAAPLALADGLPAQEAYWLLAEPVNFRVGHSDVSFAQSLAPLPAEDANALLTAMNAHFHADGWQFAAGRSGRWYLRLASAPTLATFPPRHAWHRPVRHHLPRGADAKRWHRALMEAEMLLHDHAVNRAREARGDLPVNSLWLWAGGGISAAPPVRQAPIWAAEGMASDLARACGSPWRPLPENALALQGAGDEALLWLEVLDDPWQANDVATWAARLQALEVAWLAPLWQRLLRGELERLNLLAFGQDFAQFIETRRPPWLRRFFPTKRPSLASLLGELAGDTTRGSDR